MGSSFWCWNLTILLVLFGVPCTHSSCQGNYLPGVYYFTAEKNMVKDHLLLGYVFKKLTVLMAEECFRKCLSDCQCISFNYLTTVNQDNCELNEESKYLKPNALQAKQGNQYYDLVIDYNVVKGGLQPAPCHNGCCHLQPCLNGGTCSENCDVTGKRSQCTCAPGFTGFRCEKVKWIKINTSPVCFGAQGSSYGVFTISEAGQVITFKLVYISGYVRCRDTEPLYKSNWACKYYGSSTNLAVFITDSLQQRILPTNNALFRAGSGCSNNIFYGLPGVTPDSPELVFNNFSSPLAMSIGQEFQIWYSEDLYDCTEGNNDGQTCTDMYGLYV